MVRDINSFNVSGTVTTAPEIRRLQNGQLMARFTVVVSGGYVSRGTGQWVSKQHRVALAAFSMAADYVDTMVRAGDRVAIEGELDSFTGMSQSGKPWQRITFTAKDVTRLETAAEEATLAWMPRSVEDLFTADLTPAEKDVISKALNRISKQTAARLVEAPDTVS